MLPAAAYLRAQCSAYTPPGSIDSEHPETHQVGPGEWRSEQQPQGIVSLHRQGSNHAAESAIQYRDYMCNYFNQEGAVPWQNNMI